MRAALLCVVGAVVAIAALSGMNAAAFADGKRHALVVGNASYQATTPLPNATGDAEAFAIFLAVNGFDVQRLENVSRSEFSAGLSEFSGKLKHGDTALFYFAGHGMQLHGENFLLGTDARLRSELDVQAEAISLDTIIGLMERNAEIALIFIDACRNNPLADQLAARAPGGVTRGGPEGLAPVSANGAGTMIAFAASPGQLAADGGGVGRSPFTAALIEHLASPATEIGTAFKRVIRDVRLATDNKQAPQIVSNLATEFYFRQQLVIASGDEPEPEAAPSGDYALAAAAQTEPPDLDVPGALADPALAAPETAREPAKTADSALAEPAPSSAETLAAKLDAVNPATEQSQAEKPVVVAAPQAAPLQAETDFAKAERIATARGWQLYLAKYETGPFSEKALRKLQGLGGEGEGFVSPQEAEKRLNLSAAQRKEVQLTLKDLGYDIGQPDGSFGARTRREIARYQKALGLTETGYVNRVLVKRLELVGISPADSVVSSEEARKFDPRDLEGLEDDPRVIRAAECLKGREIIYGAFEGHLYVAVQSWNTVRSVAISAAERCKAYLAELGSKAENDFVYELFEADARMFNTGYDGRFNVSYKMGPWIGLVQDEGAREPTGGWRWLSGARMAYSNWRPYGPNEDKQGDDWGMFFGEREGNVDVVDLDARTWDDMGQYDGTNSFVLEFE